MTDCGAFAFCPGAAITWIESSERLTLKDRSAVSPETVTVLEKVVIRGAAK